MVSTFRGFLLFNIRDIQFFFLFGWFRSFIDILNLVPSYFCFSERHIAGLYFNIIVPFRPIQLWVSA